MVITNELLVMTVFVAPANIEAGGLCVSKRGGPNSKAIYRRISDSDEISWRDSSSESVNDLLVRAESVRDGMKMRRLRAVGRLNAW